MRLVKIKIQKIQCDILRSISTKAFFQSSKTHQISIDGSFQIVKERQNRSANLIQIRRPESEKHAPPTAVRALLIPSNKWWSWTGSNRRPPACKAGALPAELQPRACLFSSGPRCSHRARRSHSYRYAPLIALPAPCPEEKILRARFFAGTSKARRLVAEPPTLIPGRHCQFFADRGGRWRSLLLASEPVAQRRAAKNWWVWEDLNFRPHPYQGCALTN